MPPLDQLPKSYECQEFFSRLEEAQTIGEFKVVQLAFQMQQKQNDADGTWLRDFGVPQEMIPHIMHRLAQRGGVWLSFVEKLVGWTGTYADFEESHTIQKT